uniref:Glutamate receptor n=1 Tax=Trichuris muris TaxID=70415 RepID=A0A5S6QD46_TRIMR
MFALPLLILFIVNTCEARVFWLGGLFDKRDVAGRIAFHLAVNEHSSSTTSFKSHVLGMNGDDDIVDLIEKACSLLLTEMVAFLTTVKGSTSENVRLLCESRDVPFMMTNFDYSAKPFLNSVNLYPPPRAIGSVVASFAQHANWKSGIVFFQDDSGLIQLQDLLNLMNNKNEAMFTAERLDASKQFKPQLKYLKEFRKVYNIVVQADMETMRLLLDDAVQMNMLTSYYHYFFTDLDAYTVDLTAYRMHGCNITTLRLVDDDAPITKRLTAKLRNYKVSNSSSNTYRGSAVPTYLAAIYDAVKVVAKTALVLKDSISPEAIDCRNSTVWRDGTTLMNFIKATAFEGSTGHIQFDGYGKRFNFTFGIMELTPEGYVKYASWDGYQGMHILRSDLTARSRTESLEHKILRITAYMEEPFIMYKKSVEKLSGNDRYEGFCVDLLERIAEVNKFNYTIHEVKDKSYGTPDAAGHWSGMIGELIRGEADIAVTSLTINYARSEVIDFSVPFMHLGISILYKKPKRSSPSLLSFLAPLSLDVWMYMGAGYVVVSLMLWLVARMSPSEFLHQYPDGTGPVENQFSLGNSFWFTIGSLMQQGCDIAPRAIGTRMVASVWWFFTLILISSYTANLAAFLTVERMEFTINGAEDLVKQTKIKYGSLNRGSTMQFFKDSKLPTYEKMWTAMKASQPTVFVNSSREGIARVKQGNYAYLMESSMLEFYIERDCDLTQVGGLLDSKGYGIGLRKGSPYRETISQTVLYLQEKTVIAELKEKWWKRRADAKCGSNDGKAGTAAELGLQNVGGVFVVMLVGMVFALTFTVFGKIRSDVVKHRADKKKTESIKCSLAQTQS